MLTLALVLIALTPDASSQTPHPADSDSNFHLSLEEIEHYYNQTLAALPPSERNANASWQQAHYLWTSGGAYRHQPGLPDPAGWLPDRPRAVSILPREALPLATVEVHGLPGGITLEARFRPQGSDHWFPLESVSTLASAAATFSLPYVPSPWLTSRWMEIEFLHGDDTYTGGKVRLAEIDPDPEAIADLLQDFRAILGQGTSRPVPDIVDDLRQGRPLAPLDRFLTYFHLQTAQLEALLTDWRKQEGTLRSEVELRIIEELITLALVSSPETASLADLATRARIREAVRAQREADGVAALGAGNCEPVNDWTDLVLLTKDRCVLEKEDNDDSINKKIKEKATDTLIDMGQKLANKTLEKGSKLAKRAMAPVRLTLQIRDFVNAWSRSMLPKTFVDLRLEFFDDSFRPVPANGALLQDSPYPSKACPSIHLKAFASIVSEGFSGSDYLLDNALPSADALGLPGLILEDRINATRQQVIDRLAAEIDGESLEADPCRWDNIEIPHDRDNPKFDLTSLTDVLVIDPAVAAGFHAGRLGTGSIKLTLRTSQNTEPTDSLPCTAPFHTIFPFRVDPIRIQPTPPVHNVRDPRDPLTLRAEIHDSWEHQQLRWQIYTVDGTLLLETLSEMDASLSQTSARHVLENVDPPDDADHYPLLVRMESLAQGCISSQQPPRPGEALIYFDKNAFVLTPNQQCFPPNEEITLEAIPSDEDPEFEIVEWEVIQGNATLSSHESTQVQVTLPPDPEAQIVIRAKGLDGFEGFAYFSTGPCIDFAQVLLNFPEQPLTKGQRLLSGISTLSVGYQGYSPQALPGQLGFGYGVDGSLSPDSVPIVISLGKVHVSVADQRPTEEEGLDEVDLELEGVFIPTVDSAELHITDSEEIHVEALHTGTYFDAVDPERRDDHFLPFMGDYPHLEDRFDVTDDHYTLPVTLTLPENPHGMDFSSTSLTWQSDNGEVIAQRDFREEDDHIYQVTFRYPRDESAPRYSVRLSGTVVDRAGEDETYSLSSITTLTLQKIEFAGSSTIKVNRDPDAFTFCLPDGGALADQYDFISEGCCGGMDLDGYAKIRGSVRQNTSASSVTLHPFTGEPHRVIQISGNNDPYLPFCHDLKRKRRLKEEGKYPCVEPEPDPDPDPDPDPEPDPDAPTPPPLQPRFTDSPMHPTGGNFSSAPPSDSQKVGAGTIAIDTGTFHYPYRAHLSQDLRRGTFAADGTLQTTTQLLSPAELDFLGSDVRIVSTVDIGSDRSGLLIDRRWQEKHYLDLWEHDSATGKFIGRRLLTHDDSLTILGVGDYNGDGWSDFAGVDDSEVFSYYPGTPTGISTQHQTFFRPPTGELIRAAADLPNGDHLLIADHAESSEVRILVLDDAGEVRGRHAIAKPNLIETPQAMADLSGDGIPDVIVHFPFQPNATVIPLQADGSPDEDRVFALESFSDLPQLPGPPSF